MSIDLIVNIVEEEVGEVEATRQVGQGSRPAIELRVQVVGNERAHKPLEERIDTCDVKEGRDRTWRSWSCWKLLSSSTRETDGALGHHRRGIVVQSARTRPEEVLRAVDSLLLPFVIVHFLLHEQERHQHLEHALAVRDVMCVTVELYDSLRVTV